MSAAGGLLPELALFALTDTHRLVSAIHPVSGILDLLSSPEDLEAVLELERWTDDRISNELGILLRLPRGEWVTGVPHAQVIMGAFCHPAPAGGRFNDGTRGAWYAAANLETAHAEAIHRRVQALAEIGAFETVLHVRLWQADFNGEFRDLRPTRAEFAPYYDSASYAASRQLTRELFAMGSRGIVYRSVRRAGGVCIACWQPRSVNNFRNGGVYEYRWSGRPDPVVRAALDA